jgi:hypothetical protein
MLVFFKMYSMIRYAVKILWTCYSAFAGELQDGKHVLSVQCSGHRRPLNKAYKIIELSISFENLLTVPRIIVLPEL